MAIETSLIAWATTSANGVGADAGITVEESVKEDGIVRETRELDRETVTDGSLDHEDDPTWLDENAADELLHKMGYELLQPFTRSGGQYAAIVGKIA